MRKRIVIIGGGPAALMLANTLDPEKFTVTIYEKNKALGRKFLVAGKGGFNLTHSEQMSSFIQRYYPPKFLEAALKTFDNQQLINWLEVLGIPTFVGSSKRVFPTQGIKPIAVLKAIQHSLEAKNVNIYFEKEWIGWGKTGALLFRDGEEVHADIYIYALGGASWKITGSDGQWKELFEARGIKTSEFLPANCAYEIDWEPEFLKKNEGKPLKNIAIRCKDRAQKGEVVITSFGLEGNAIYALSREIQAALNTIGKAKIFIDLKPMLSTVTIHERLSANSNNKTTDVLKQKIKLSKIQIDLLKSILSRSDFLNVDSLTRSLKNLPLTINSAAPLDEAISTTGGIALSEVNEYYELKKMPGHYCIGEMLDWYAPTGGYLLQGCFSMGRWLGDYLNAVKITKFSDTPS